MILCLIVAYVFRCLRHRNSEEVCQMLSIHPAIVIHHGVYEAKSCELGSVGNHGKMNFTTDFGRMYLSSAHM